jgi:hypothetical protein
MIVFILACTIKLLFTAYLTLLDEAKANANIALAGIVNYVRMVRLKLKRTFMITK